MASLFYICLLFNRTVSRRRRGVLSTALTPLLTAKLARVMYFPGARVLRVPTVPRVPRIFEKQHSSCGFAICCYYACDLFLHITRATSSYVRRKIEKTDGGLVSLELAVRTQWDGRGVVGVLPRGQTSDDPPRGNILLSSSIISTSFETPDIVVTLSHRTETLNSLLNRHVYMGMGLNQSWQCQDLVSPSLPRLCKWHYFIGDQVF